MNLPMKMIRHSAVGCFICLLALSSSFDVVRAQSETGQLSGFPQTSIVVAHKGATGMVKMRMDRMEAMGAEMKRIGAMVRDKKGFDGSKISAASERIAQHGRKSNKLFPQGSLKKPTQALPKIWKDWQGFTRAMNAMVRSATVLAEAGRAGNKKRARTAYFALGKSCGACHRTYRVKKKRRP
ncbi:MAG: hypothetical protein GKS01_02660 [Alphaproteobacteria bacterium]|nr:hypothetical protein [Alphaproteobacteria bacterium]